MFSSSDALIECVPNFSEGCDVIILDEIKQAILSTAEVVLLHVDPNHSANRTVYTFIGKPDAVCEAAFKAIRIASLRIDMQLHKGEHPRIGATDVCPLIPIANISIEETDQYAQKLAKRVGDELQISVFCYEHSTQNSNRKRLEQIRKGEYENLSKKLELPEWKPDFGPTVFNAKSGATTIGARHFLIAFNINLETKSVEIAQKIAEEIRESGRTIKNPLTGEKQTCKGLLTNIKAIGWYISDFDTVQVSTNITNFNETSIYKVVETIKQRAQLYKTNITGCELVGLVPKKALIETGAFYNQDNENKTEEELIAIAVTTLQLNSVKPFDCNNNILENRVAEFID